jgi:hypothetical protein
MKILEIGCGEIIESYDNDHLDLRPLPHIEFVQGASDLSNFEDNSYDMIYTKFALEHIGWRKVRGTLKEWFRVAPILDIEVPALREALDVLNSPEAYSNGKGETQWEAFNRVLFGDQGYPEDIHLSYFTLEWLKELLIEAGAEKITVIKDTSRIRVVAQR